MMDFAYEIKQAVPMRRLLEYYGIEVNRMNKARCPFHGDHTPSMQVYSGDRGYWCFVCNEGGDVIDFTRKYFKLSFHDAIRRINTDFGLRLPLDEAPSEEYLREAKRRREEQAAVRRLEAWRENTITELADCARLANLALKMLAPSDWSDKMFEAVRSKATIDNLLDTLDGDDAEAQMQIFRNRREVRALCSKILENTPPRSTTA